MIRLTRAHVLAAGAGTAVFLLSMNVYRDSRRLADQYVWDTIARQTLQRSVSSPGIMEAIQVAQMLAYVDETVEKKWVQEGDSVKKGQILVELSRTNTQLEFQQRRTSAASAEADVRKTSRELSVQRKLLKNLAASRQQVEDAEQSYRKALASRDITLRELEIAQKKLDSTVVKSPLDGVVLKDATQIGDRLTVGKEIVAVGDISQFIVKANIDELDIQQIQPGQRVWIEADAYAGKTMRGVVRTIASQAEREAFAKIKVMIDITDAQGLALKHNLSVRSTIITEDLPDSIGIPVRSILRKNGNHARVLVRNRLGFLRERNVVLGVMAGPLIQVTSGLTPGERVATPKMAPAPL